MKVFIESVSVGWWHSQRGGNSPAVMNHSSGVSFLSNLNANFNIKGATIPLMQQNRLLELSCPEKKRLIEKHFLPDTENIGSSVFSRKMRPMHRVLFVFQTRDCHWNASVNTRFCQFSLLLFGIQSNHRISIREHSYPSAYKHTKLELRILFLALLFFALSQLYSFLKSPHNCSSHLVCAQGWWSHGSVASSVGELCLLLWRWRIIKRFCSFLAKAIKWHDKRSDEEMFLFVLSSCYSKTHSICFTFQFKFAPSYSVLYLRGAV